MLIFPSIYRRHHLFACFDNIKSHIFAFPRVEKSVSLKKFNVPNTSYLQPFPISICLGI